MQREPAAVKWPVLCVIEGRLDGGGLELAQTSRIDSMQRKSAFGNAQVLIFC